MYIYINLILLEQKTFLLKLNKILLKTSFKANIEYQPQKTNKTLLEYSSVYQARCQKMTKS